MLGCKGLLMHLVLGSWSGENKPLGKDRAKDRAKDTATLVSIFIQTLEPVPDIKEDLYKDTISLWKGYLAA